MSAPTSEQRLAEIAALAEAATPGPWCTDEWEIYTGAKYLPWSSLWIGETCRAEDADGARADAAFIAAAREAVPALLAEIERLRKQVADVRANALRTEAVKFEADADRAEDGGEAARASVLRGVVYLLRTSAESGGAR